MLVCILCSSLQHILGLLSLPCLHQLFQIPTVFPSSLFTFLLADNCPTAHSLLQLSDFQANSHITLMPYSFDLRLTEITIPYCCTLLLRYRYTCSQSHYSVTAVIYFLILWLLPCSWSICHSIKIYMHRRHQGGIRLMEHVALIGESRNAFTFFGMKN